MVKTLQTVEEANTAQAARWKQLNTPAPNGVACPSCGHELTEISNPAIGYVKAASKTDPPHWKMHCPSCSWEGLRIAC